MKKYCYTYLNLICGHSLPLARKHVLTLCALLLTGSALIAQSVFWTEDFEDDGNGTRYSSSAEFVDAEDDYFGRVRGSDLIYFNGNIASAVTITLTGTGTNGTQTGAYTGYNGNFYMAGEDVNDIGGTGADGVATKTVDFKVFIGDKTGVSFLGLFAAGNEEGCDDDAPEFDLTDFLRISFNVDGAGFTDSICIVGSDHTCAIQPDDFNIPVYSDPNCDGDGADGVQMTNAFTEFSFSIPDGDTVEIRMMLHADAGDEELAFDYFRLMGSDVFANDICADATLLSVGSVCANTTGTNQGASASGETPSPSCGMFGSGEDVWYAAVVPASGSLTIEMSDAGGPVDWAFQIYSGLCGALALVECDDDDGTGLYPLTNLTSQTPGDTLRVRVFESGNDSIGQFNICAYSSAPTLMCNDITVTLDAMNQYVFSAVDSAALVAGSDPLTNVVFSPSHDTFFCPDIGVIDITITADGGAVPCAASITVEGATTVSLTCPGKSGLGLHLADSFSSSVIDCSVDLPVPTFDDDCGFANQLRYRTSSADSVGGSTSAASGWTVVSHNPAPASISEILGSGYHQVEWELQYDDGGGNQTDSCTDFIYVEDNTAPVALCVSSGNLTLGADGTTILMAWQLNINSADNCTAPGDLRFSFSATDVDSMVLTVTCMDVGLTSITIYVWDEAGNNTQCTAMFTINDETAPLPVCNDITVYLDDTGSYTLSASDSSAFVNGTQDTCSDFTTIFSQSAFGCGDSMVSVMATYSDASGNMANCMANVLVLDTVAPVATCQDVTIYLDASGMVSITAADVDGGSSDNCGIDTMWIGQSDFTCSDIYEAPIAPFTGAQGSRFAPGDPWINEIHYDNAGADAGEFIEVAGPAGLDLSTYDLVLYNGSNGATYNTVGLSGTIDDESNGFGALSFAITGIQNGGPDGVALVQGATVLEFLSYEASPFMGTNGPASGMTSTDIGVSETSTTPIGQSLQRVGTGDEGSDFTWSGPGAESPGDLNGMQSIPPPPPTGGGVGIPVDLIVVDSSGNVDTCTAYVVVLDTVAPSAVCQNITVYLDGAGMASINAADLDGGSTDACGIDSITASLTDFTCADVIDVPILVLLDPDNENYGAWTPTTTSTGSTVLGTCNDDLFSIDCTGGYPATNGGGSNGSFDDTQMVIDDDAAGGGVIGRHCFESPVMDLSNGGVEFAFDWDNEGLGTDGDAEADVFDGNSWVNVWTFAGGDAVGSESLDISSFTNADFQVRLCYDDDGAYGWGAAFDNVLVTATGMVPSIPSVLSVTDSSGNVGTCTANVTVLDTIAPVCAVFDTTLYLDASGMASLDSNGLDAGSADNCPIASIDLDLKDFDCSHIGSNTVTQTVVDASGNTSTCTATVNIVDTTAPDCMAQDITVFLDENGEYTLCNNELDNGSTDNCGYVGFALDSTNLDCSNVGTPLVVTQTAYDGSGGTIGDIPSVGTGGISSPLDSFQASISGLGLISDLNVVLNIEHTWMGDLDIDLISPLGTSIRIFDGSCGGNNDLNGTFDDEGDPLVCAMPTIGKIIPTEALAAFDGENADGTWYLTIKDNASGDDGQFLSWGLDFGVVLGNSTTCTGTVTVLDTVAPYAACADITVYLDAAGMYSLSMADSTVLVDTTQDNCASFTTTFSQSDFTCSDSLVMVTMTYTDGSSNTSTCTANVLVLDTVAPTAVCQDIEVYLDASGMAMILSSDLDGGSSDACGDVVMVASDTMFDCTDIGLGPLVLVLDPDNENYGAWTPTTTSTGSTVLGICNDDLFSIDCTNGYPANNNGGSNGNFDDTQMVIDDDAAGGGVVGIHCFESPVLDLSKGGISFDFDWDNEALSTDGDAEADVFDGNSWVNVWTFAAGDAVGSESLDISSYTNSDFQVRLCYDDDGAYSWGVAYDNILVSANSNGSIPVVLTVTDSSGNSAMCTANVTVLDTVAPACAVSDTTLYLDGSGMASLDSNSLDNGSADACGIASVQLSQTTFGCGDAGMVTVTQTVKDANGNVTTCDATVTVLDTISPVITCTDTVLYANDTSCGYQLEVNYAIGVIPFDTMSIRGTGTSVSLGDDAGSAAIAMGFDFEFYDNMFSEVYIASNGYLSFNNANLNDFSADVLPNADGQDNTIAFAWEDLSPNLGGVITYETMGTSPNQVFIVEFYQVPHFGNNDPVTVQVKLYEGSNTVEIHTTTMLGNPSGANNGHTMGLENGSGTLAAVVPGRNDDASWTATNEGILFTYDEVMNNVGNVTASDNCVATIDAIAGLPADGLLPVGMTVITYQASDESGNMVTCMSTITVLDTFAPVAVCNDISVYLDETGNISLSAADSAAIVSGAIDNCDSFTVVFSQSDFTCADDTVMVTVDYTDGHSNMSSCVTNVVVLDTLVPSFVSCFNINVPLNASGTLTVPVAALVNLAIDNCGAVTPSYSATSIVSDSIIDCSFVVATGTYVEVSVYYHDESGNVQECIAGIRADDLIAPVAACADITIDLGALDTMSLSASDSATIIGGTMDNCASALDVVFSQTEFTCAEVGTTVAVDVTVTDPDGNSDVCTAMVTVDKTGAPVASCSDITITVGVADYSLSASDSAAIVAGAGDCVDSVTFSQQDFSCADVLSSPISIDVTYWFNGLPSLCVSNVNIEGGAAGILYVNHLSAGGDGSDWGLAFQTLSEALVAASSCGTTSEIWVAEGTYVPTDSAGLAPADANRNSFVMAPGVGIYGGFDGTEPVREDRNWVSNLTELDGQNTLYHVIANNGNGLDNTAILDGFTIKGGNANGPELQDKLGGGMYNNASSPHVENCVFTENAAFFGGGMLNQESSAEIVNSFFKLNSAVFGGGMFNWTNSTTQTVNCVFAENTANKDGAGAHNNNCSPAFINCSFSLNVASRAGGGIGSMNGAAVAVDNGILWGDSPDELRQLGGTITASSCIVEGGLTGTFAGVDILDLDPLYVDAAGCDLSLDMCSPAIDAGDDIANSESFDIIGNARISGDQIDMGAYEYQGIGGGATPVLYVDVNAGGDNDGRSWTHAFTELSSALATASNPSCPVEEIWVAQGSYNPIDSAGATPSVAGNNAFVMPAGIGIYGGFVGGEAVRDARDWDANLTTLDGAGAVYHVVYNNDNGLDNTAILDGFTISGGAARGPAFLDLLGGGMRNKNVSPTVDHCIFTGNDAFFGGGMLNEGGAVRVLNTRFDANTADFGGGAFNWMAAATEHVNNVFVGNIAALDGGAMQNNNACTASVINSSFTANSCSRLGGAIFSSKTSVTTVRNSIAWSNSPDEIAFSGTASNDVANSMVMGGHAGVGNVDADPLFVNPGTGDLRLMGGSPALDAGDDAAVPADILEDIAGDNRFQSASVDMGAYEGFVGPVRLAKSADELKATVYPNPTADWLNVDMKEATGPIEWEVRDMQGHRVERGMSGSPQFQIDMTTLPSQQYIIMLKSGDQILTKRVIRVRT